MASRLPGPPAGTLDGEGVRLPLTTPAACGFAEYLRTITASGALPNHDGMEMNTMITRDNKVLLPLWRLPLLAGFLALLIGAATLLALPGPALAQQ